MLEVGLMMAGWGLGFRLGYRAMDRWLDSRRVRRERQMRNVTPGRVA